MESQINKSSNEIQFVDFVDRAPYIGENKDRTFTVTVESDSQTFKSDYSIENTYENDSIWLYAPMNQNPVVKFNWVIAFRGTQVLEDIFKDFHLMLAVAGSKNDIFNGMLDETYKLLKKTIFSSVDINPTSKILILGHSLGASIAESMFLNLENDGFSFVKVVLFDSPGLSKIIRNRFNLMQWSRTDGTYELTMVYANDNIVNNLSPAQPGAD